MRLELPVIERENRLQDLLAFRILDPTLIRAQVSALAVKPIVLRMKAPETRAVDFQLRSICAELSRSSEVAS
jgi:hypothetical protein